MRDQVLGQPGDLAVGERRDDRSDGEHVTVLVDLGHAEVDEGRASVRRIRQLRPAADPSPRLRASGSTGIHTPLGGAVASQEAIRRSAHVADGPSIGSQ